MILLMVGVCKSSVRSISSNVAGWGDHGSPLYSGSASWDRDRGTAGEIGGYLCPPSREGHRSSSASRDEA